MFQWKEDFSCNVKSIDDQHKTLFKIGSKLYSIYSLNDGFDHYDEIMEVLYELKEYTIYHFRYEEELLKKYGYKNLEAHIKQHNAFVDEIISFENEDIDDKQKRITMDMLVFVSNWIENHILKTDKGYIELLNSNGAK